MKHILILMVLLVVGALAVYLLQDPAVFQRTPDYAFVYTEPRQSDAVGTYVLADQTVLNGGISALQGHQCEMVVTADGSVSVTNYPDLRSGISADRKQFTKFISGTGSWRIGSPGTSRGKTCWGMRFSGMGNRIAPVAFIGETPPYGLIAILGDPDCNMVMIFRKKEKK